MSVMTDSKDLQNKYLFFVCFFVLFTFHLEYCNGFASIN